MKTGLILALLLVVGAGCRRTEDHDITVWRIPKNAGLSIEIAYQPLSQTELDSILQKVTDEYRDIGLIVCLPPGVSVTNSFGILNMAEKHGITNVTVRLNQTRPPRMPKPGDQGIIYDAAKEEAPTSKRTVP